MNTATVRRHIMDAIQAGTGILHDPRFSDLLAGSGRDVTFVELEFDSLLAMEFCIEIEDRLRIEIEPAVLVTYPSIDALAGHLQARCGHG